MTPGWTSDDHRAMEPDGEHRPREDGQPADVPCGRPSWCAPLSRQENEVLDGIEHGLAVSDPGLFARMSALDDSPPVAVWARVGGGLAFGGMLLVFLLALPAAAAWAVVGLVAVAVLVPWLLSGGARWPHRS